MASQSTGAASWATVGAAVVAVAALTFSVLAWREARRSADAAEKSAQAANRSAAAEEAALALAVRDAEQRKADRYDGDGPRFRLLDATVRERPDSTWIAVIGMRVKGGPERMTVRVQLAPSALTTYVHRVGDTPSGIPR